MKRKLVQKFISWLISKLATDDRFTKIVEEVAGEVYIRNSLKQVRIWGDSSRLVIGKNVHLNNAIINTVSGTVTIKSTAFLGHSVSLLTGTHDYEQVGAARQVAVPKSGRDIVVGEGVWIASNVTVIGPCEIGENAVIGSGSVVTGKIQANSIYAGVPAKFIRHI
jgi:acetyltransferase-like isoleucine patch superfamily enzyme